MGMSGQPRALAASTHRKYLAPIVQEAGWAPGPVCKGGKSRPNRDSIPDRPACSSAAIPTDLPGPLLLLYTCISIPSLKARDVCFMIQSLDLMSVKFNSESHYRIGLIGEKKQMNSENYTARRAVKLTSST